MFPAHIRLAIGLMVIVLQCSGLSISADAQSVTFGQDHKLQVLWNEGEFTEGVAVRSDGVVFFSDIPKSPDVKGRILCHDPESRTTFVFCSDSRKSNGLYFDAQDQLYACCGANGGARALCRVTGEGMIQVLTDRFEGRRLNSPNDLVIHPRGFIYFSDPRYVGAEAMELDHQSVYRFDRAQNQLTQATFDISKPNGVHVSPDGKTLYVAETNNGATSPTESPDSASVRMTLNSFDIGQDGSLSNRKTLVSFGMVLGVDGMAVHSSGAIFAAVRSPDRFGIVAYTPTGTEIEYLATPELPTNCCFGTGHRSSTLYITAGGGLYSVSVSTK